ncbi:MAG: hypothetical protein AABX19_03595 [Nanoarchaeota archaeon]
MKKELRLSINPTALAIGFLFIISLWLADINILIISDNGIKANSHITPNIEINSLILVIVSVIVILASSTYYFFTIRKKHDQNLLFAGVFSLGLAFGILIFLLGGLGLIIFGHDSYIIGVPSLGIYHSSIPILLMGVIGMTVLE